jgi:hypothetical protein
LWVNERLVYPPILSAPLPHEDLAQPAASTYMEARGVAPVSPRAAAALLRLCLQQLVAILGAKSDNLNTAVGQLVTTGLPPKIQQAMDAVRVIGNESVHPGTIDVNDNPTVATSLFDLVNLTVDAMVTQPKLVEEMYNRLPASKREAIEGRDSTESP